MGYLEEFRIPFSGLSIGNHNFVFEVDSKFFDCIEYSEVKEGKISIEIDFTKHANFMELITKVNGKVTVPCDRCLDNLDIPVNNQFMLVVKFGEKKEEITDEILTIPHQEHQLFLADLFYEYIMISLPHKKAHEEGKCNKEVEKYINVNNKATEIDPRWKDLEKLKN